MISRPALLALAAAAVIVAGCGSGSSGTSAGPSPTPSPTPSLSPSSSPSPSPVTVTPTPKKTKTAKPTPTHSKRPVSACAASQLRLSLGPTQGAAGNFYTPLILTNQGGTTCTMFGYPGVSYISSNGANLGPPASRMPGHVATVTLKSGGAASALLHQPNPLVFPPSDCHKKQSAGIRVYPPGQTVSVTVSISTPVCTTTKGRSGVTPMQPGTDPTL